MSATFTVTVTDSVGARIVTALAAMYHYQENIPDPDNPGSTMTNPQSQSDFAMAQIERFLCDTVFAYEATAASQEAIATVNRISF